MFVYVICITNESFSWKKTLTLDYPQSLSITTHYYNQHDDNSFSFFFLLRYLTFLLVKDFSNSSETKGRSLSEIIEISIPKGIKGDHKVAEQLMLGMLYHLPYVTVSNRPLKVFKFWTISMMRNNRDYYPIVPCCSARRSLKSVSVNLLGQLMLM